MLVTARRNATSRSTAVAIMAACLLMPNQPLAARNSAPKNTMPKPTARRVATLKLVSFMVSFPWDVCGKWLGVLGCLVDELHVAARHESFDVGQHQHALAESAEAGDEARFDRSAELRRGADLLRREHHHVGHRVDDDADHAPRDAEDDHHGELVVAGVLQAELEAQVDDRHDRAAQIDHALDELGRAGDAGRGLPAADLLHLDDLDAVLLGAETEAEELAALGVGGSLRL